MDTRRLRQLLVSAFNDGELRDLCFDLGIDYESLPGQGKADKARELIAYAQRRRQEAALLQECRRLRPHIDWDEVAKTANANAGHGSLVPRSLFVLAVSGTLFVFTIVAFFIWRAVGGVADTPSPTATASQQITQSAASQIPSASSNPTQVLAPTTSPTTAPTGNLPAALTPLPAWAPELVEVPAGDFLMGSNADDPEANADEKPQHTLTLPTYWIGKTEVTNAQFQPFVEGDGYTNRDYWTEAGWQWREQNGVVQPEYWNDPQWNGDSQPVVGISWFEAVAYCRWLSAQTGMTFRLPTEAEWEKAARGPDGVIYPWGNSWDPQRANSNLTGIRATRPVGQYPAGASPYGALDMAGNVWEWNATRAGKSYAYQIEDEWDAAYLADGASQRMIRGGSWYSDPRALRGAFRNLRFNPSDRGMDFGLRVIYIP